MHTWGFPGDSVCVLSHNRSEIDYRFLQCFKQLKPNQRLFGSFTLLCTPGYYSENSAGISSIWEIEGFCL